MVVRHADEELTITNRFAVEGSFIESRMVGTFLYAATRVWEQYTDVDPFVDAWVRLDETSKLSQFFSGLQTEHFQMYPVVFCVGL